MRPYLQSHDVFGMLHRETLIHSDQDCHYTSYKFIQLVKDKELRQSESRKANCWDNDPQESFYGHMKDEIDLRRCQTHAQVVVLVNEWIHQRKPGILVDTPIVLKTSNQKAVGEPR